MTPLTNFGYPSSGCTGLRGMEKAEVGYMDSGEVLEKCTMGRFSWGR